MKLPSIPIMIEYFYAIILALWAVYGFINHKDLFALIMTIFSVPALLYLALVIFDDMSNIIYKRTKDPMAARLWKINKRLNPYSFVKAEDTFTVASKLYDFMEDALEQQIDCKAVFDTEEYKTMKQDLNESVKHYAHHKIPIEDAKMAEVAFRSYLFGHLVGLGHSGDQMDQALGKATEEALATMERIGVIGPPNQEGKP